MQDRSHELRQLLAAIVETSDDAIVSKDLDGTVTSWNQSAQRIFGYTAEEIIGRPISILAAPDRVDEMPAILDRVRHGERVDHYETERRRKDGRIIDVSLTISPIRDTEGNIVGASKIARDISERKMAERAIIEQSERLARSNADLQEFAYVVSHDLQEPLRTVAAMSQLLARRYSGRIDAGADELIRIVVGSAERMAALIRDVLSYSRGIKNGPRSRQQVNVAQLVEWVREDLKAAIEETRATIDAPDLPSVAGDAAALSQILQNLVGNALKYRGPEPPRIRISAESRDGEWIFSVADNGIGIPEPYQQTIFRLFKRLHAEGYPGTGIGLALCKRLIEKQGGRIWVESVPGQGSTFRFSLPREHNLDARPT